MLLIVPYLIFILLEKSFDRYLNTKTKKKTVLLWFKNVTNIKKTLNNIDTLYSKSFSNSSQVLSLKI